MMSGWFGCGDGGVADGDGDRVGGARLAFLSLSDCFESRSKLKTLSECRLTSIALGVRIMKSDLAARFDNST
ncbi:hypothetical protein Tco_1532687 [Tanacetum coccineum]